MGGAGGGRRAAGQGYQKQGDGVTRARGRRINRGSQEVAEDVSAQPVLMDINAGLFKVIDIWAVASRRGPGPGKYAAPVVVGGGWPWGGVGGRSSVE